MRVETRMEFSPICPEQLAGVAYYYDAMNYYILGKTVGDDGGAQIVLLQSDTGNIVDVCDPVPVDNEEALELGFETSADGRMVQFCWRTVNGAWTTIGSACETSILTDEHCCGFTGAHVGLYVHDMAGLKCHADYDDLRVHYME